MRRTESPVLHAKVCAMYGKRLKREDFTDLLSKNSLEDITVALKEHHAYGPVLTAIDPSLVHRGHLEAVLKKEYFRDLLKLFHYLGREDQKFLRIVIRRYEIEEILWCLGRLHDPGVSRAGFVDYKYEYFDRYSDLNFEKLSVLKDEKELIEALADTPYGSILAALPDKTGRISYATAEHHLHSYYFKVLFADLKKRYGDQKASRIEKTVGIEVDTINILLIYRLRILFRLPEEQTKQYLFEACYKLRPEMKKALLAADTEEQFVEALRATPYRFIADNAGGITFQNAVHAYADRSARKIIHFSRHPVALILAFLVLKETEMRNLKTVIEGCRYHTPQEELASYLIVTE